MIRYVGRPPKTKPGDKVRIHGLNVTVVSQRQAEKCAFVVCVPVTVPLCFADNETGPCSTCGQTLQWRPHAPKRPPRICMECLALREAKPAGNA